MQLQRLTGLEIQKLANDYSGLVEEIEGYEAILRDEWRLLDLIRSLVARLGIAVVLVTHDIAVARLLAARIMVMQRGRVVETGLTDQVLDDPQHPYTQLLVSSVLAA